MSDADRELARLIHASGRHLDDHAWQAYLDLYVPHGEYRVTVKAPELAEPMIWLHLAREELATRLESVDEHEWEIAQLEQTRLLSVDRVNVTGETAEASTSFAVFNTDAEGRSACYAVGRYEDRWHGGSGAWLLEDRRVALRTRLLSPLSPIPI